MHSREREHARRPDQDRGLPDRNLDDAVLRADGAWAETRNRPEALFEADADIMPEPEKGILRVRILGMAGKAMDKAVVPLLEALNMTETKFPDTELRLVCELPGWGET